MKKAIHFRSENNKAALSMLGLLTFSAVGIYLSVQENFLWLIGNIIISALMWSWFSILHSTGHNTYFKNRTPNIISGHMASFFVMVPFFTWQSAHAAHHRWTGYKDLDPSANEIPETPPAENALKILEVLWKIGMPVLSLWHTWNGLLNSPKPELKTKARISQAALYIPHLILLVVAPLAWAKIFVLPYFIFLMLSDAVLTSQHADFNLEKSKGTNPRPHSLGNQEKVSRSFYVHPWIDRWVFLNFNLHSAHHLYPQVPHYYLDQVHFAPTNATSLWNWYKTLRRTKLQHLLWRDHL